MRLIVLITYYLRYIISRWKRENPLPSRYFWGSFSHKIQMPKTQMAIQTQMPDTKTISCLECPPKSKALFLNLPLRVRGIKGVIFLTPLSPLMLRGGLCKGGLVSITPLAPLIIRGELWKMFLRGESLGKLINSGCPGGKPFSPLDFGHLILLRI